ncbi:flavodoxin domain-containing protein [Amycolatopsis benzoatilytica]|uniref:flavodoxin domain-containing protein n=1 Tax=Amycolatopsis benzoatilytica TaxID=346045 RepID=UPI000360A282|nr:flavodoxin domain-containing protein [Amycolatopsis benzoatilytica]
MRLLVAVASRHGSTRQIAEEIGRSAARASLLLGEFADVEVRPPAQAGALAGYDAVILGSAVYNGRWLDEARRLAESERVVLARLPVWLLSCGLPGTSAGEAIAPAEAARLENLVRSHEHRVFRGKLDWHGLDPGEREHAVKLRLGCGDQRDWADIRNWAYTVIGALHAAETAVPDRLAG